MVALRGLTGPSYATRNLNNTLLSGLPGTEWDQLRPNLQAVELPSRMVVFNQNQAPDYLYFIQSGYVSLMIEFSDGFAAEVCGVGREGVLGVSLLLDTRDEAGAAVVQVPTLALRVPSNVFIQAVGRMPLLHQRLLSYAQASRAQSMQLVACNARHGLPARLARCLLSIMDRIDSDMVSFTHETLSMLLCTHRPTISVAIKQMERAGLVRVCTGALQIVDVAGLENAACECRHVLNRHRRSHLDEG